MRYTNLLAAMAGVAAAFVITITLGFQIHKFVPAISETMLGVVLGIAIPVIAAVIFMSVFRQNRPARSKSFPSRKNDHHAYKAFRLHRRTLRRPREKRLCRPHGRRRNLLTDSWETNFAPLARVEADCRVNLPEVQQRFPLAPSVHYQDGYSPERAEFDNPWAQLSCSTCPSQIDLVHPEWPKPKTKLFPDATTGSL